MSQCIAWGCTKKGKKWLKGHVTYKRPEQHCDSHGPFVPLSHRPQPEHTGHGDKVLLVGSWTSSLSLWIHGPHPPLTYWLHWHCGQRKTRSPLPSFSSHPVFETSFPTNLCKDNNLHQHVKCRAQPTGKDTEPIFVEGFACPIAGLPRPQVQISPRRSLGRYVSGSKLIGPAVATRFNSQVRKGLICEPLWTRWYEETPGTQGGAVFHFQQMKDDLIPQQQATGIHGCQFRNKVIIGVLSDS